MSRHCDETYDLYHELRVFARQQHECDAVMCDTPIRKGDPYWRISIVFEGTVETIKRCVRCQAIHEHLRTLGDGFDFMWPDERLDCGEEYREHWGQDPPPEIEALAFWQPGQPLPCKARCAQKGEACYDWRSSWWQHYQGWPRCGGRICEHRNPCTENP